MIYLTGDTHADFHRFTADNFPDQKEMTKDDLVIVLGDFGGIWAQEETAEEKYWLDWLNDKPFTLCYLDGNHENFDRYYSNEFSTVDFCGGKSHQIRDSIFHLMRGYIYDFEGCTFFCMGGASSHDIKDGILDRDDFKTDYEFNRVYAMARLSNMEFRINHSSWWEEEIPSDEELLFGLTNLKNNGMEVNYVLSHCLPQEVASVLGFHGGDKLTRYFNDLLQDGLKFDSWWCGHYHTNTKALGKYNVLYKNIQRIL